MLYLGTDLETTGTNERRHDIMTAYFAVYNEDLEFVDELDLKLKPDDADKVIIYDPEAREVTGIDLDEHLRDPETITYSEAKVKILKFLEKHKIPNKRKHFRFLGQNVEFDIKFLKELLSDEDGWEKLVHHGNIDTFRICTFLQDCDLLAGDIGNLGSLVEYFGLPMGIAHNAKEDVKMTVSVYKELKKMISASKNNISGVLTSDLLSIVEL
jgi:DNA polymerase III alpha subunit (gram-positive type)